MKLYVITASNEDSLTARHTWCGTQAQAAGTRKEFIADGFKRVELSTYEVDVPTGKDSLIEFLNDYGTGIESMIATRKIAAS